VVFVIRTDFAAQFKERFEPRLKGRIEIAYAYQSLDKIPEGHALNPAREKPWGTAHAVWMADGLVNGPMAVINADDFYGREAYQAMADFLVSSEDDSEYAMIGYHVNKTLSPYGSVSRGVCVTDSKGHLTGVVERTKIQRDPEGIFFYEQDEKFPLAENCPVSMNFWGLKPNVFQYLKEGFSRFLDEKGNELKSEYFIPLLINDNILNGRISTRVIDCNASWFGVTYIEDKPLAQQEILKLVEKGEYPVNLWDY